MPSQAENNTSVEPPRRPCPGSSGVLLPVLKSNSGCPRCLVVLCDGLCVLPRLMKSPGLRRELLGDGRIRIRAPAECGIDLGLQRGTLIGECGASGRGGDDEGDDEAFHLASSLGLSTGPSDRMFVAIRERRHDASRTRASRPVYGRSLPNTPGGSTRPLACELSPSPCPTSRTPRYTPSRSRGRRCWPPKARTRDCCGHWRPPNARSRRDARCCFSLSPPPAHWTSAPGCPGPCSKRLSRRAPWPPRPPGWGWGAEGSGCRWRSNDRRSRSLRARQRRRSARRGRGGRRELFEVGEERHRAARALIRLCQRSSSTVQPRCFTFSHRRVG